MERKVIGSYKVVDGKDVIEREAYGQGFVYKNPNTFYNEPDEICYIPENSDRTYTRKDFLKICNNQSEIALLVFEAVDWLHPEVYMEEQIDEGELSVCHECGKIYESYDYEECPHCKKVKICTHCGQECFDDVSPEIVFSDAEHIICEDCSIDYEEVGDEIKLRNLSEV